MNVDAVASRVTVSVRQLNDWRNLLWEFRKRNADEAKDVFTAYFDPATENGPFAEMIEAIGEKIREAILHWMNETVFNSLRHGFIKQMDVELEKRLHNGMDSLNMIERDITSAKALFEKCNILNNRMKEL